MPAPAVLIAGGGPVGLTLAAELFRHGVPCRVIDKLIQPEVWSKAAAVQARTLEVFRDMGVSDAILSRGRPVYGINIHKRAERFAHVSTEVRGTPYPFILGISQRETEDLLLEHLVALGGHLERGVTLEGFTAPGLDGAPDAPGPITATLLHADGRREIIEVAALVGCDGARSRVREVLGLPFEGSTFEEVVVQADVRVRFPFKTPQDEGLAFVAEGGPLVALPLLAEGRYRVFAISPPDPEREPSLELFEELAAARGPEGMEITDPLWMAKFRFHGRVVPSYRRGMVFLAGDAAHIHSPVGAQGMNMGIQDAYNLAWKLALVLRAKAQPRLLDSYDPERRPIGETTVQTTDRVTRAMARAMTLRSPLAQDLRNQAIAMLTGIGVLQDKALQGIGGMTVNYAGSPAVGEHHTSVWRSNLASDPDSELPQIGQWLNFSQGPGAGARVSDIDLPGHDGRTLFDLLQGTRHTLLLFDGASPSAAGYKNLTEIAEHVARLYGELINVHIVVPAAARPEALTFGGSILLDPEGALHQHFHSGAESLSLIRPDGYVGFRSQPAEGRHLLHYLNTFFIRCSKR